MYLNFKFVLCGRSYESKNQETYQWCLYQCLVAIVVIEKKKKKTFAVTARPYVGSVINYISILKTLTALVSGMGQKS